jgi:hypothetical protein
MQLSLGFFVVAICGFLLVIAPTVVAASMLWRKGGASRFAAGVLIVVALLAAGLGFADAELPRQFEEAMLLALMFWGLLFYTFVGFSAGCFVLRRIAGLTLRCSGRLRRPLS